MEQKKSRAAARELYHRPAPLHKNKEAHAAPELRKHGILPKFSLQMRRRHLFPVQESCKYGKNKPKTSNITRKAEARTEEEGG